MRTETFFVLGQQGVDELGLRRRLASAHQFAQSRLGDSDGDRAAGCHEWLSYDKMVVLVIQPTSIPRKRAAERSATVFCAWEGTENPWRTLSIKSSERKMEAGGIELSP